MIEVQHNASGGRNTNSPRDNRMTKTPTQVNGLLPSQIQKFKRAKLANSALKDMVVIYADMNGKHIRQKAVASQIRTMHNQTHNAQTQNTLQNQPTEPDLKPTRMISETTPDLNKATS